MGEWQTASLGDLADVLDRRRVPVREEDRPSGTIPYYGANGQQGWIDRPLFNEPLILLAEDGGFFDEFADRPIAYRIDGPSWVNNHAHVLRAGAGVYQSYLFWSLRNKDIRRWIAGGTRSKLTRGEMEQVVVPVPPLEEQRRIAEILDTIDETIQATERVIDKLEHVIEGVLQRASLGRPDTEYPAIAISDFCSLSAGRTAPRGMSAYYGGEVPWVKSGEVAGLAILSTEETVTAKAVQDLGLRIIRAGTPLIAMYGATAGEVGWLGIDAATNQAVLAVEPEAERADRRWLYWALRLNSGRMLASIQGSGQPNLSKQIIGAMPMSLPDIEKQVAEVERVDSTQASVEAQRAVAMKLHRTRAGLAADLLSGRVRTVPA